MAGARARGPLRYEETATAPVIVLKINDNVYFYQKVYILWAPIYTRNPTLPYGINIYPRSASAAAAGGYGTNSL